MFHLPRQQRRRYGAEQFKLRPYNFWDDSRSKPHNVFVANVTRLMRYAQHRKSARKVGRSEKLLHIQKRTMILSSRDRIKAARWPLHGLCPVPSPPARTTSHTLGHRQTRHARPSTTTVHTRTSATTSRKGFAATAPEDADVADVAKAIVKVSQHRTVRSTGCGCVSALIPRPMERSPLKVLSTSSSISGRVHPQPEISHQPV